MGDRELCLPASYRDIGEAGEVQREDEGKLKGNNWRSPGPDVINISRVYCTVSLQSGDRASDKEFAIAAAVAMFLTAAGYRRFVLLRRFSPARKTCYC
jgi:hypothetical protein